MSFKLLAIRPLENCDSDFLKNLKRNYIYRFYNEYDYLNNTEDDEVSIIDTQYNFSKDLELQYVDVQSIRSDEKVPQSFYGRQINVSAIVGKNGSGKSSLLELLYAFIFNISKNDRILKFEDGKVNYNKIGLEIYYEFNNDFYKIIHRYKSANRVETEVHKTNENYQFIKYNNDREIIFKFYFLVINYSIYSLNSKVSGPWIKKLFHKNDGYQSPIVINPFRTEGNIDVNNEYNLAQQRLILNHFVIKNGNLIEGINLHEVNYSLNIRNAQYFNDKDTPKEKQRLIIDDIINFFDVNNFRVSNRFSDLIDIILTDTKYARNANEFKKYLQDKEKDRKFTILKLSDNFRNEIRYLCLLYLFKKLKRISYNYDEYKIYSFLFKGKWHSEIFNEDLKQFKATLSKKVGAKSTYDLIDLTKYKSQLAATFRNFINKHPILIILRSKNSGDIEFEIDNVLESVVIDEKDSKLNDVVERIFESLTDIIDRNRIAIIENYIIELKNDDTHIAFKFRQAVNYFVQDLFAKIKVNSVEDTKGDESDSYLYNIAIDQKFLSNAKIHEVPISFFEPEIVVRKYGEIYPFNKLSSGEQQMIHSMLNITYHLYYIASVKKRTRKKKYEDIIIIFDEVELYFHPEFQRGFINNLLKSIEYFRQLSFNIIFSTHSPFILSDIPSQNVLRLDEGFAVIDKNELNSFGANIHDLLADEFFLKGNTIGEFANSKIDEILEFLFLKGKISELRLNAENMIFSQTLRKEMSKEIITLEEKLTEKHEGDEIGKNKFSENYILEVAELIGEPLIKFKIKEMVKVLFNSVASKN